MSRLYKIVLTALVLLFPQLGTAVAHPSDTPAVRAVLLMSPGCGHCHYVITEVLQPMAQEYGDQLQILVIDVTTQVGSVLYHDALDYYGVPEEGRGVPTLIIGDEVLVGSLDIPAEFPGIVANGLASGGIDWPAFPGLAEAMAAVESSPAATVPVESEEASVQATPETVEPAESESANSTTANSTSAVYLAYFYDPTCLECAQVSKELAEFEKQYPNLVVNEYNLLEDATLNEALCEKYGVPEDKRMLAPAIFIGSECLTSGEITQERLARLIQNPDPAALTPPWSDLEENETEAVAGLVARFREFGGLAVAGAGLLDGVNPCAFTTIIFFVSYLALVGRKGRDTLFVGGAFTLAVFLTYLVMGLGLTEVVRQLKSFTLISQIIYGITAVICLVLAALSIWDFFKIRRGELTEIALQLPKSLKNRIHATIRSSSRTAKGYIGAAFVAGVLVSVFELACTGQVYLPTIIFVTGVAEVRPQAIAYLLLYSLMFVVPLIAVFTITYFGTSSKQLAAVFQANAGAVKLLTAVLFAVLGLWLGYMVLSI